MLRILALSSTKEFALLLAGASAIYLGAAVCLWAAMSRLVPLCRKRVLTTTCFALAPVLLGWVAMQLFVFIPGRSPAFYVLGVFGSLLCLAAAGHKSLVLAAKAGVSRCRRALQKPWSAPNRQSVTVGTGLLLSLGIWAFNSGAAVVAPLSANDPLEYAALAQRVYDLRSLTFYPAVEPDAATGYYDAAAHPPSFSALQTWLMMLQGSPEMGVLAKSIAPFSWLAMICLVGAILSLHSPLGSLAGMLLIATLPLLQSLTAAAHIDPLRVASFLAAFALIAELSSKLGTRASIAMGIALGLAVASHSIGLLALPLFVLVLGILGLQDRRSLGAIARSVTTSLAVAAVIGGYRYLHNLVLFGSPINNDFPLVNELGLRMSAYMMYDRSLVTFGDRMTGGVLRGLVETNLFGPAFWLALAGTLLSPRSVWDNRFARAFLVAMAGYAGMMLLSVAAGVHLFIMNPRYLTTIAPFAVVVGTVGVLASWRRVASALIAIVPKRAAGADPNRTARVDLYPIGVWLTAAWVLWANDPFLAGRETYTRFGITTANAAKLARATDEEKIRSSHDYLSHIFRLRELTEPDAVVLALRFGDFAYYAKRRYVRELDPRMRPVYLAEDAQGAYRALVDLKIDYIYMPGYLPITVSETLLGEVIADPRFVTLVATMQGQRLFKINEEQRDYTSIATVADPAHFVSDAPTAVGTMLAETKPWDVVLRDPTGAADGILIVNRLRGARTAAMTRRWMKTKRTARCPTTTVQRNTIYELQFVVSGDGFLEVDAVQLTRAGKQVRTPIWNGILPSERQSIRALALTGNVPCDIGIRFQLNGRGVASINGATATAISYLDDLTTQ